MNIRGSERSRINFKKSCLLCYKDRDCEKEKKEAEKDTQTQQTQSALSVKGSSGTNLESAGIHRLTWPAGKGRGAAASFPPHASSSFSPWNALILLQDGDFILWEIGVEAFP